MTDAMRSVMEARTALVLDAPFFGVLSLRLELQEDPSCPTAWTDGQRIGFNPSFTESLSAPELRALLAHEILHVSSGHPWRRDSREPKRWNHACDYAINSVLAECGFELPAGALLDAQFTGKSAEWIYDRLPQQDGESSGSGSGEAPAGEVRDAPEEAGAPTEEEAQQATQQAAAVAAAAGALPGGVERFAKELARSRVDWRSTLRRFAQASAKADYSYRRPSSRYLARGLFLPSLHSEAMGRLAVAVDVSGSVDDTLLAQLGAELQAILEDCRPEAIDVLYCDTAIQRREEYRPGDVVDLRSCGGGGTDFRPVFAELQADPPVALVYLSDLYGRFPDSAPEYPVLWGVVGSSVPPFGESVRID